MPVPAAVASSTSRPRRLHCPTFVRVGCSAFLCIGSQRRPSSISTVVTASTTSWVSAKSGAENQMKVMQQTSPAPDASINAASRWNLACHAAPSAQTMPMNHVIANIGENGSNSRPPRTTGVCQSAAPAATTAKAMSSNSCDCSRRVPSRRRLRRPASLNCASACSNMRWPSNRCSSGVCSRAPNARRLRCSRYNAAPPASATKLIISGRLKPCHTAKLYSGNSPPTTGAAAVANNAPIDQAGATPTTKQTNTSSSTGTRIQCGGSCGVRGTAGGAQVGPKNTSNTKRAE